MTGIFLLVSTWGLRDTGLFGAVALAVVLPIVLAYAFIGGIICDLIHYLFAKNDSKYKQFVDVVLWILFIGTPVLMIVGNYV